MKGALTLGTFRGIKIAIHWSFFILLLWIAGSTFIEKGSVSEVISQVVFLLAVFACVVLHELGHALMAGRFGIRTRDITLLPIGGVARLEKMPEEPRQELLVALAGPAVNVVIAGILFLVLLAGSSGFTGQLLISDLTGNSLPVNLMIVNVSLIVFNLIPAFPMDGGRVLRAVLAMFWSREKATRVAVSLGQGIAVLFVIAGLFYNPFLILIGVFVFIGAQAELGMVEQGAAFKGVTVRQAMITDFISLPEHVNLKAVKEALLSGYVTDFLITGPDGICGVLTRDDLIRSMSKIEPDAPMTPVIRRDFITVTADEPLELAWTRMRERNLPLAPVVENGRVLGVLSQENIAELVAFYLTRQPSR